MKTKTTALTVVKQEVRLREWSAHIERSRQSD